MIHSGPVGLPRISRPSSRSNFNYARALNAPYFIGGNGLRAVSAVKALEEALNRPVLTANQVAFWQALVLMGLRATRRRRGPISTTPTSAQTSSQV